MASNNIAPAAFTKEKAVGAGYSFEAFFDLPGFTKAPIARPVMRQRRVGRSIVVGYTNVRNDVRKTA
jgi:hypothetical protein